MLMVWVLAASAFCLGFVTPTVLLRLRLKPQWFVVLAMASNIGLALVYVYLRRALFDPVEQPLWSVLVAWYVFGSWGPIWGAIGRSIKQRDEAQPGVPADAPALRAGVPSPASRARRR
jgi:hypothetical protein